MIFYSGFVDGKLDAPKSLLPAVHRLYFEPQYPEFSARNVGNKIKEGRHVGLDFYDLLIEALKIRFAVDRSARGGDQSDGS